MKNGITVWRLVNDAPYYRILYAVDNEDFKLDTTSRLKRSLSSLFYSSAGIEVILFGTVCLNSYYFIDIYPLWFL